VVTTAAAELFRMTTSSASRLEDRLTNTSRRALAAACAAVGSCPTDRAPVRVGGSSRDRARFDAVLFDYRSAVGATTT